MTHSRRRVSDKHDTYPLVWILLRLVVAVIEWLPLSAAPLLTATCIMLLLHGLLMGLLGSSTNTTLVRATLALVVPSSLVVISVHPRLVLGVLLLLILIPADASGSWIAALPIVATIVASTTLVAALTPAIPHLVVL